MTLKFIVRLVLAAVVFALVFWLAAGHAFAQGRHPAYLRTFTDLRHARAHLVRNDGGELRHEEREATFDQV